MNIPKYFDLGELLRSDSALALGIENLPDWDDIPRLQELCLLVLDPLRNAWGQPLIVSSGFRTPELNAAVGGVPASAHIIGCAADVRLASWSKRSITELYNLIVQMVEDERIDVDQVILYRKKKFIHISNELPCRRQFIVK